jgi:hypothetical protein
MSQLVRCYACRASFPLEPEALHPYREGLIRGQRTPHYWIRCPACGQKNVIELDSFSQVVIGKPPAGG